VTRQIERTAVVVMPDAVAALNHAVVGPLNFDDWVDTLTILQKFHMPPWTAGGRVEPRVITGEPK
jgi:hypothetical protein